MMTHSAKPRTMMAVVTTGVGGTDKLAYKRVPVPRPGPTEVLLRVLAAGVNNTEINTRLGWYSSSVTEGTEAAIPIDDDHADGGWNGATPFPIIQGTDCCGQVIEVGTEVDPAIIGDRVLVRPCFRPDGYSSANNVWMGSDFDGAFAQYVKVPAAEAFRVQCDWSDAELATIPCAYGTAENMLHRADIQEGQRVLIPGASGGVGSAAVQLAKRRGAEVVAIASAAKHEIISALGADQLLDRGDDPVEVLGKNSIDVVIDNVGGPGFGAMLEVLKQRGTYVSSGAIAGPVVDLDMRTMYLKDIRLLGCTGWDEPIFPDLIGYIERGEIQPLLAQTYPLDQIATAQQDFGEKRHVGKLVLIPPE